MKRKPLKVYGLSDIVWKKLQALSKKQFGKPNVSLLARQMLIDLSIGETSVERETLTVGAHTRSRLELKLPPTATRYLEKAAEQGQMTPNMVAVDIIMEHIDRHPVLSDHEANALYQSNYQLLRIGRNLNQIARQLNAGEQASLSWQQLDELMEFIRHHTEQANRVLQTRRRRLRK